MSLRIILAVAQKDIFSEIRTRSSLIALALFSVASIVIVVFATLGEKLTNEVVSALLWVLLFFSSMTGLSRSFVQEEERGTSLYLRLLVDSQSVFLGKLIVNILLAFGLTIILVVVSYLMFLPATIQSPVLFLTVLFVGAIGIAICTTIISAIIARVQGKGVLFPVLSIPILLPFLFTGVDALLMSMNGTPADFVWSQIVVMVSYSGVIGIVSSWLFDVVWSE